ncbi:hypothetical protein Ddc_02357 [Ditylenchus destructor]|nr:hypothetical protein Ddc_02357 [Ditylenchus destructor]
MGFHILAFCIICALILIFLDTATGRIHAQENFIGHRNHLSRRENDYLFPLYSSSEERPSFVGFPTPGNLIGIRSESPYGLNMGHTRFSSYISPMLPSRRIRWRGFRHTNQGEVIDSSDIDDFVHVLGSLNWTDSDSAQFLASTETFAFESMLNLLFSKIVELQSDELRETGMSLLQKYSPPKSMIDATKAWTTEQKAQVRLLVTGSRTRELHIVLDGLITSLPDEDQRQARISLSALNFLSGGTL